MKNEFIPVNQHILIQPEEITDVEKEVKTDAGNIVKILTNDHSKDKKVQAINKGRVMASDASQFIVDDILIYYPYSANKIKLGDVEYHVIHEKDVMGKIREGA